MVSLKARKKFFNPSKNQIDACIHPANHTKIFGAFEKAVIEYLKNHASLLTKQKTIKWTEKTILLRENVFTFLLCVMYFVECEVFHQKTLKKCFHVYKWFYATSSSRQKCLRVAKITQDRRGVSGSSTQNFYRKKLFEIVLWFCIFTKFWKLFVVLLKFRLSFLFKGAPSRAPIYLMLKVMLKRLWNYVATKICCNKTGFSLHRMLSHLCFYFKRND